MNRSVSRCGPFLDDCACALDQPATPAEQAARHRAALARAERSGWAAQARALNTPARAPGRRCAA